MFDQVNEIQKQIQEIKETQDSLKKKSNVEFAFSLTNFSIIFIMRLLFFSPK